MIKIKNVFSKFLLNEVVYFEREDKNTGARTVKSVHYYEDGCYLDVVNISYSSLYKNQDLRLYLIPAKNLIIKIKSII